jgi:hypothetical protein
MLPDCMLPPTLCSHICTLVHVCMEKREKERAYTVYPRMDDMIGRLPCFFVVVLTPSRRQANVAPICLIFTLETCGIFFTYVKWRHINRKKQKIRLKT